MLQVRSIAYSSSSADKGGSMAVNSSIAFTNKSCGVHAVAVAFAAAAQKR